MIRVMTNIEFDNNEIIELGSIRIGEDSINNVELTPDGEFKLNGNSTVWDDLLQPATTGRQGSQSKPDFDYNLVAAMFPRNDPTEILYFNIQLPHEWKEGSRVYPHVHFLQNQNILPIFKVDYKWIGLGDILPANWSTYTMSTNVFAYTSNTVHQIVYGNPGIDGTGKTLSSILQMKLYRDDNVYVGDCAVVSFDIHIEKDTLGSFSEFTK